MKLRILLAFAAAAMIVVSATARADTEGDLKAKLDALQKQLDEVKAQLNQVANQQKQEQQEQEKKNKTFLQMQEGSGLNFVVPGGGLVGIYGNLDVSFDYATKGLAGSYSQGGSPLGNMGWEPDISTNLSYIGIRGNHPIQDINFVWQLEAGFEISANPGTKSSTSNNTDVVNGALFSRNSFIGLAGKDWGAVKIGKSETPYKTSTDRLNPFSGMEGDYRVIMGNTGGDNRVEFGYRAPHAIWYESPNWNGVYLAAMYAPGQNRDDTSSIVPSAEGDCAGGNIPGSGALPPTCNDGSFGNLYSVSLSYLNGPLYLVTAYEMHKNVNRTSDTIGFPTTPPADTTGDPNDIGDESAYKIGGQYTFATQTTVSLLWERTKRKIPDYLQYQNERTRNNATWLAITQVLTDKDSVSFGWAHAGATPGDPGQHNTPGGANPPNSANMYALNWRHNLDRSTQFYVDWALTKNQSAAHYDLGAGGHAVTTDCHDSTPEAAFDPTANGGAGGVTNAGPHCFAGGRIQAISVGFKYTF
jgi:predicted porin